jgi:hypothetical protein
MGVGVGVGVGVGGGGGEGGERSEHGTKNVFFYISLCVVHPFGE